MKHQMKKLFAVALLAAWFAPLTVSAQITEPDTVFYGQIINRTSGQLDLITQGKLVWNIIRPDGQQVTLITTLQPVNKGVFSYRLLVPHQVLTYGLTVAASNVPLAGAPANCSHLQITVDGVPASIVAPGSSLFTVAENMRAATYRLDLELLNPLADSAGDGIPDWWKALYGVTDPNADADGDGWSNLQEFRNGGKPTQDNRIPSLATTEFWVYADGVTEIPLDVVDSDSTVASIHYTLTSLPGVGTLYLHNVGTNGSINDVALALNDTFTQDDVNQGRFVFVHNQTNAPANPTSFTVILGDENPAHTTNATVTLNVFRPNYSDTVNAVAKAAASAPAGSGDLPGFTFSEQQMLVNYYLSRDHDYILADSSRATVAHTVKAASAGVSASLDNPYVLVAGAGNDRLVGGTTNDILIAGRGKATLRGNGGADLFILPSTNSSAATVEDFSVDAGDALDISRLLQGASTQLTNYVQLTSTGTNSVLGINFAGSGTGYTNLTVTLNGAPFATNTLRSLVDNGNLLTGNKVMLSLVSIVASVPAASQNGPASGQFTLTRSGSLASPLTANLSISGSAANGSSYELIPSAVTFDSAQRTLTLPVNPYANGASVMQIVQVAVAAGTGYGLGTPASAQVTIEPLLPQITIEAIEPDAVKSDLTPGTFLVSRTGIYDRSVTVRFTIGGTASSSTDYNSISTALILNPNVTAALISVVPKSTANLTGGPKYVQVAIKADPSYKVMTPSADRVFIVDQMFTHDSWQARYFSSSAEAWSSFANRDTGNTGIKNLYRYAYGLNPTSPSPTNGLPAYQIVNGHLCVSFRRPLTVTDYDYVVEVSDDLVNWSALPTDVETFTPANANTNDVETVSFRSKAVVSGMPKQFMRVLLQPR
jgi:hypothetical protein